jgi:beta-glucosidase
VSVERAPKQLAGFARVHLEPEETKTVEIWVPIADLAYYDTDSKAWRVEDLDCEVLVGPSSRDIHLRDTFRVTGT